MEGTLKDCLVMLAKGETSLDWATLQLEYALANKRKAGIKEVVEYVKLAEDQTLPSLLEPDFDTYFENVRDAEKGMEILVERGWRRVKGKDESTP